MTLLTLILTQSLLYPSVTELYRQGKALTMETCAVPSMKVYADDAQLSRQKKIFEKMPSVSLRSDLARWFSRSRNAKSGPVLLELLAKEKNSFVRLDLVRSLQNLKDEKVDYSLPADFASCFLQKEAPAGFKAAAMTLYKSFYPQRSVKVIFKAVQEDMEPYLLNTAYLLLKDNADQLPRADLIALYKKGKSQSYGGELHCFAASLLSRQKLSPEWNKELLRDLKSEHLLLAARIAEGTAQNPSADPELIRNSSWDGREAVRLGAAKTKSLTREKLEVLLHLCTDRSSFVREEALRSFGRELRSLDPQQRETVLLTLLSGVKDPVKSVREASICSLTAFSLSAEEHSLLLSQAYSFAPAWEQIIYYARKKQLKSYAPAIAGMLDPLRKDVILLREALLSLGEMKYIPAVKQVMNLASSKDPSIRQACAFALGCFRQKISFPTLKKLLRDKEQKVAFEAAKAMFTIGGKDFTRDHLWLLRTRTSDRADQRAIALRSLAKEPLPASAWKDLETLLLKECIVEPMSPPMPDACTVRISVLMLLHTKSLMKDPRAGALLSRALKELSRPGKDDGMEDPVFDEYFRQFRDFRAGKKVLPGKIKSMEPIGAVKALK